MECYAIIDTNVIVSAMLKPGSTPRAIFDEAIKGRITPLYNDKILDEYIEVLGRSKFGFDRDMVLDVVQGIIARGISIDGIKTDELFQDPDDAVFYEIAMEAKLTFDESYLVTGNTKHFPNKPFVVTPKEMLDILNS